MMSDPLTIIEGDCLLEMRKLSPESVDSCVTDPPYHLTTGKKGGTGEASVNLNTPAGRARVTCGFMGKKWDGGDVAFQPDTWREVFRVLKPGAHLVAFSGTRTYHRMVCAIEDAGFEIRDQLAWIYGSGFPKSSNQHGEWEGWGTALKPAWEPIVLARKPMIGTVPQNLAAHRTGAMNIEGCRVPSEGGAAREGEASQDRRYTEQGATNFAAKPGPRGGDPDGRWPANILHDGSAEVVGCFPESDGQCGDLTGHSQDRVSKGIFGDMPAARDALARGDSGSAARFFYCAKADRDDRNSGLHGFEKKPLLWSSGTKSPGTFQAEGTDRSARNPHPTVKPVDVMRWLCRLVTPPGGTILDPFMGSGSTGKAALGEGFSFIGIEREAEYVAIARARCCVNLGLPI